MLTEEEFKEWKAGRLTQEWFKALEAWRENLKEQWAQGAFNSDRTNETATANVNAVGQVRLLEDQLSMGYAEYVDIFDQPKEETNVE